MLIAETERLRIRYAEEKDCEGITTFLTEAEVNIPLVSPPYPFKEEDARAFYAKMKKSYDLGKPEFFALAERETDAIIGGIGVHPEHTLDKRPHVFEIGYWLGRPYWGRGFMTEALPVVMAYAFNKLGVGLLVATTNTNNEMSQHLLQSLGFEFHGIHTPIELRPRGTPQVTSWQLSRETFMGGGPTK